MPTSKTFIAIFFIFGMILLCWRLTPFIHNDTGELVHTHISFVGKLLVGRFLIYIAILATACLGIAIVGQRKNLNP